MSNSSQRALLYRCVLCNKEFENDRRISTHVNGGQHENKVTGLATYGSNISARGEDLTAGYFQCLICEERYEELDELQTHSKVEHARESMGAWTSEGAPGGDLNRVMVPPGTAIGLTQVGENPNGVQEEWGGKGTEGVTKWNDKKVEPDPDVAVEGKDGEVAGEMVTVIQQELAAPEPPARPIPNPMRDTEIDENYSDEDTMEVDDVEVAVAVEERMELD